MLPNKMTVVLLAALGVNFVSLLILRHSFLPPLSYYECGGIGFPGMMLQVGLLQSAI